MPMGPLRHPSWEEDREGDSLEILVLLSGAGIEVREGCAGDKHERLTWPHARGCPDAAPVLGLLHRVSAWGVAVLR